jgi:hypothetical protein
VERNVRASVTIVALWLVLAIGWTVLGFRQGDPLCALKRAGIVATEEGIGKSAWCDYKNAEGSLKLENILARMVAVPLLAALVLFCIGLTVSRFRKRRLESG